MFGSNKRHPHSREFADRLDALLVSASSAGVGSAEIADILEGRAQTWRTRSAVTWTHGSVVTHATPGLSSVERLKELLHRES